MLKRLLEMLRGKKERESRLLDCNTMEEDIRLNAEGLKIRDTAIDACRKCLHILDNHAMLRLQVPYADEEIVVHMDVDDETSVTVYLNNQLVMSGLYPLERDMVLIDRSYLDTTPAEDVEDIHRYCGYPEDYIC